MDKNSDNLETGQRDSVTGEGASGADADFSGLVDIGGGRRPYLECRGAGGPTVVLESGYRNNAEIWSVDVVQPDAPRQMVFPAVAEFARVCAYDRPGTNLDAEHRGRSDPVPMPRAAADAVADLHRLLHVAGVPGPYVLVGHSYGGLLIRLYAATYPNEVVGLVLIDASHEDQNDRYPAVLSPEERIAYGKLDDLRPPELEHDADLEVFDFAASSAQMRAASAAIPLPAMPLVVLSHGRSYLEDPAEEWEGISVGGIEALERESRLMQQELASLTADAHFVVASKSGHFVQCEEPELVIEAVRAVVEAVREPATWAASTTAIVEPAPAL